MPKDILQHLSRRDFLKAAGAAAAGTLLAACGAPPTITVEPTRPITPTNAPSPVPTPKEIITPTPQELIPSPEPTNTPEVIKVDIPELKVVRQQTQIDDITAEMSVEHMKKIKLLFDRKTNEHYIPKDWSETDPWIQVVSRCGESVSFVDLPSFHPHYLYDNTTGRFYTGFVEGNDMSSDINEQGLKLLSWTHGVFDPFMNVSSDGKLLYSVKDTDSTKESGATPYRYAQVLVDIHNRTRTVFQFEQDNKPHYDWSKAGGDAEALLTCDGNKILLSSPFHNNQMKVYLVDLPTWNAKEIDINTKNRFESDWMWRTSRATGAQSMALNKDGSLVYSLVNDEPSRAPVESELIDTITGNKIIIRWPLDKAISGIAVASQNLKFVAHEIQMQYAYYGERDNIFGAAVFTPEGFFQIQGGSDKNNLEKHICPVALDNDGTLYTNNFPGTLINSDKMDVFRFTNGTYQQENLTSRYAYKIKQIG